jgi:hypothetical protein
MIIKMKIIFLCGSQADEDSNIYESIKPGWKEKKAIVAAWTNMSLKIDISLWRHHGLAMSYCCRFDSVEATTTL